MLHEHSTAHDNLSKMIVPFNELLFLTQNLLLDAPSEWFCFHFSDQDTTNYEKEVSPLANS